MSNGVGPRRVGVGLLGALLGVGLGGCANDPKERALAREDYGYMEVRGDLGRRIDRSRKLRVPDLRPRSPGRFVQGDDVAVEVKVRNQGDGHADRFDVVAQVTVPAQGAQPSQTFTFTIPVSGLDPGEESSSFTGAVSIAGLTRPVDLSVQVTVDPTTPSHPRGDVFEWDESNNVRTDTIRIF